MTTLPKIRVMIIDDHDLIRQGLRIVLEDFSDLEIVADTADARTGIALCSVHKPDVVLMDMLMPNMEGVTATRLLRNTYPHAEVIALTSSSDGTIIKNALDAGVIGYMLKSGSIDELATAIRDAYQGKHNLAPEAVNILMQVQHPFLH